MFTNRFIKVPVDIYSNAEYLGFNENSKAGQVMYRINPMEISFYREYTDDGEPNGETSIFMKNGESIVLAMPIDKFEKLLNESYSK